MSETALDTTIHVSVTAAQAERRQTREKLGTPSHWQNKSGTLFKNPWDSWRPQTTGENIGLIFDLFRFPSATAETKFALRPRKPTWGIQADSEAVIKQDINGGKIKATFLGHACFLLELPIPPSSTLSRGPRILFDPVFSHRCSPVQFMGPARFTPAPCSIDDIPEVDAVVISHNHYDHLDTDTISSLFKRPRMPHVFAPLGNGPYFRSLHLPKGNVHTLDWWDSRRLEVDIPIKSDGSKTVRVGVDITCTPCQHFTGRKVWDNMKTLWSSWVVESVVNTDSSDPKTKVYFAGDTAYRTVKDGEDEDKVPICPVFKEIGDQFGGFDLALIPIGAYLPRGFMSSIHCAPQDSVLLFKDVKAKKAIGMHWGTWALTTEDILEPPKRLKEECEKVGIEEGAFITCDVGETTFW